MKNDNERIGLIVLGQAELADAVKLIDVQRNSYTEFPFL